MAVWFASRVVRDARVSGVRALAGGQCAPHLIHATAMLYMVVAVAGPAGGPGDGRNQRPGEPGAAGPGVRHRPAADRYATWDLDQLSGPGPSGHYSLATARVARLAGATAG